MNEHEEKKLVSTHTFEDGHEATLVMGKKTVDV